MKALLALLLLLLAVPALAQTPGRAPMVQARLVAEQLSARPGGTLDVALEQKIRPGWHTYWVDPGDVGLPTTVAWTLPPGWKAGAIAWPAPKRLPVGPFMDYGYEGKVWLLSKLSVPADAHPGDRVMLKAAAHFLVCRTICIPEDATLSLPVTIGTGAPDPATADGFATARAALPVASPWPLAYALNAAGKTLDLFVAAPALGRTHPIDAAFFPLTPGAIKGPAAQMMGFAPDGLVLRLVPGPKPPHGPLNGVLVLKSADGSVQALSVTAPPGAVPAADFVTPAADGGLTPWLAVAFAFLGGLILNVMPCVLPVLAMKALSLAGHAGRARREAAREGLAYGAGAVLGFLAFGLAVLVLRSGGAAIGWGFQLQEPVVVAALALLIFAVGLNLSGVFEVGTVTVGGALASRTGAAGAFFTGLLAVAVASPCTAPFMAAALGFALTQGAAVALAVFLGLGVGFALPFVLLGLWPKALAFLPKPGPWMIRLRQVLAFPMYGAAVWLAWVLAREAGADAVAILLAAALALALAAWLWRVTRALSQSGRRLGIGAVLVVLLAAISGISLLHGSAADAGKAAPAEAAANGERFTAARLATLRKEDRPVFVNATAAWCITCLVNEKAVLSQDSIKAAFARKHVAYLVADWTSRDAAITRLLERNGRSGVPLYLYYAPGARAPVILPQILTRDSLLAVLNG